MEPNVYLIGNAHIDPVWLWRWQEGYAEIKATFQSALDRMEEFPNYKFTSACACYYEWVEQNEPEMFEKICQRVFEGRWNISGGWWIQPDCNIPCGESFARQGLYSQRYFKEKFGIIAKTGYNVDSFGHNGMLPQILKKSGMDNYVFMRPSKSEKELLSSLFIWQSADGSEVTTFRLPVSYNTSKDEEKRLLDIMQSSKDENIDYMAFYGIGNHGGGPTIVTLSLIEKLIDKYNFSYGTPDIYFDNIKKQNIYMPTVFGDIQNHARGCYSAHSLIKANNRKAEHTLVSAEKASVLVNALFDIEYPYKEYLQAWKNVMFNQFHDILCGCSLKEAYDDSNQLYGEALSIGNRHLNFAFQKISWNIDTTNGFDIYASKDKDWKLWENDGLGTPVVLYNPLSWEVTADISCGSKAKFVTDNSGSIIDFQQTRTSPTNGNDKYETRFMAKIPPFGYTVYRIYKNAQCPADTDFKSMTADDLHMENDYISVSFHKETGRISSIFDKKNQNEVLEDFGCSARVIDEQHCDTWAHNIERFDKEVGQFGNASIKLIENGPVCSVIRATSYYNKSVLRQDFILHKHASQIEVRVKLDWREEHKMLKLSFPVKIKDPRVICETAYGYTERQTIGIEDVCQQWVYLSGNNQRTYGLGLLNDSKYSYDACGNILSLTVVRSPIYADHFGERDEFCEFTDQGIQDFSYVIYPHIGEWYQTDIVKKAYELNCKPQRINETFHKGNMPCEFKGINISSSDIIASALKCSEDKRGYILRCYETNKKNTETAIELPFLERSWQAEFNPCEIKTFYIPKDKNEPIWETDLIESAEEKAYK